MDRTWLECACLGVWETTKDICPKAIPSENWKINTSQERKKKEGKESNRHCAQGESEKEGVKGQDNSRRIEARCWHGMSAPSSPSPRFLLLPLPPSSSILVLTALFLLFFMVCCQEEECVWVYLQRINKATHAWVSFTYITKLIHIPELRNHYPNSFFFALMLIF